LLWSNLSKADKHCDVFTHFRVISAGFVKVQPVLRARVSSYLAQQKAGKPGTSGTFPVIINIDAGSFGDRNFCGASLATVRT
jgi:hypothetical protein